MVMWTWQTFPFSANVKRHQHMKLGVWVGCEGKGRQAILPDRDPQLFAEFADKRLFRAFVRLELASGKFP